MARISNFGLDAPQSDSAVSAIENNPGVAAQPAAIDPLQRSKNVAKRYIDEMGQLSTETPGGIFGKLWPYGGKIYTDQQLADAKSAVDRAQNDDEVNQAINNFAYAGHQDDVGTGVVGRFARGMNNTPIASIGNNSFLGNNRTTYELPGDDSSWAYAIGKYGGGGLELASDLTGVGDVLKMAKAARFNPFTFAGMLYRDAKQTGKDIVNLPGNIVNGIRNAGSKTSNFVKDSVKAGTEGKSLKAYNAERTAAPAPRQEPAPQQPAPAPRQEPAPAPRQEPAPAEGSPELRSNADGTPDLAGTINGEGSVSASGAAGGVPKTGAGEAAGSAPKTGAGEAAADGGVSELANAGNAGLSSADEAMEVAKGIDGLVRRIKSGVVDEMDKAWIEALANQKAAGFGDETINYILNAARAAGVIK